MLVAFGFNGLVESIVLGVAEGYTGRISLFMIAWIIDFAYQVFLLVRQL